MFLRKEETVVIDKNIYCVKILLEMGKERFFDETGLVDYTIDCRTFVNHSKKPSIFSMFQKRPLNYNLIAKNTLSF